MCSQAGQSLVLFIDDLQWLNAATCSSWNTRSRTPWSAILLFTGADGYNDVGAAHALSTTITAIRAAGGNVSQIALEPLHVDLLAQLCAREALLGKS